MTDYTFTLNTAVDDNGIAYPLAHVVKRYETGALQVRCPYCSKTHVHGITGHTSAGCWAPKPQGYERGYYVYEE
jgi:hypothetical protein